MLHFETTDEEENARLQLLLDEGLELLAAFRRIADPARRAEILALTEQAANNVDS